MTAREWLQKNQIKADAIACHGHTVFHDPSAGFSIQIGSGAQIAAVSGIDTITQFRSSDIALGGQGAPLAPVADLHLFSGYSGYLNLGGIANITLLSKQGQWKAWDICPCNQVLNHLAGQIGFDYDPDGKHASTGKVIEALVNDLKKNYPPRAGEPFSLSNASVRLGWISHLEQQTFPVMDLLATVSRAIASIIMTHITDITIGQQQIMVSGGGVHNHHLMQLLREQGEKHGILFLKPADQIIDCKESLLMAYLGYLHLQQIPLPIHQLTGSRQDSIGGVLYKAPI
jgi:anhydro-N-acetylmuramic acid kinase